MKNTDLGKRLKKVRLEKGYTQEILAEKISTTTSYISDIERGVKTPSLNTFIVIINALAGRTYKAVMTATISKTVTAK